MTFEAVIEIPKGSKYKYEIVNGSLTLDRPLNQIIPFSYGFIPRTLADDGDGLDVFVIHSHDMVANVNVTFTPIGVFKCFDNGEADDKVIGILANEEYFWSNNIDTAKEKIKHYLETYKDGFEVLDFKDANEATMLIRESEQNLIDDKFYR